MQPGVATPPKKIIEIFCTFRYFKSMLAKKGPVRAVPAPRAPRTPLEQLQARRLAINTLIESLEEYDQYRARRLDEGKRKSA